MLASAPLGSAALASFSRSAANLLKCLVAAGMSSSPTNTHALSPVLPLSPSADQPGTAADAARMSEFFVTIIDVASGRPWRKRATVSTWIGCLFVCCA